MKSNNRTLDDPLTGERIELLAPGEQDVLRLRLTVRREGGLLRPHSHPQQEETIHVVRGALVFWCGGAEQTMLSAGEALVVAPGVRHSWRNAADSETEAVIELRPPLDAEEIFRLAFARDAARHARRQGRAVGPIRPPTTPGA